VFVESELEAASRRWMGCSGRCDSRAWALIGVLFAVACSSEDEDEEPIECPAVATTCPKGCFEEIEPNA
jgi:hypothetical protein